MYQNRAKILIVEDEAVVAMSLKKMAASLGYEVTGMTSNYSDAVKTAEENIPDLLLADIRIKGEKDGIETACEIKKKTGCSVIFLTAYNDATTFEKCMELNPSAYLQKPFREHELRNAIAIGLNSRRSDFGKTPLKDADYSEKVSSPELTDNREMLSLAMKCAKQWPWEWNLLTDEIKFDSGYFRKGTYWLKSPIKFETLLNEVIYPDDAEELKDSVFNYLKGETSTFHSTFRVNDPEGNGFLWIHCAGAVVERDSFGKPVRMVGINQDSTELHIARMALQEANRKLNLLSSVTRHDIINQMMVLLGYREIIDELSEIPKESASYRYFQKIYQACLDIKEKIEFTGDYQDLGIKKPDWISIERTLESVSKNRMLSELEIINRAGNPEIYADPMFDKVLFNLFENSVRHGRAGKVTVSFYENERKEGVLIVEDDGSGVSDDIKDKIFFQGFGSNTGYGLFLVKEILDITGIKIKETGIFKKGARFEIKVPSGLYRI